MENERDSTYEALSAWGIGTSWNDISYHISRNGAYDLAELNKLKGRYGFNGSSPCDVLSGPCSCGASH